MDLFNKAIINYIGYKKFEKINKIKYSKPPGGSLKNTIK